MKYKLMALTLILTVSLMTMSPGLALAQTTSNPTAQRSLAIPVSGTSDTGVATVGTFYLQRFATQDGKLVGIGTLVAAVTDSTGTRNIVVGGVAIPVEASTLPNVSGPSAQPVQAQVTCPILHLELGPLDLNLLGLMIHLDKVVLDITAQSGPGNLLGNLLCAIAGLLDQTPNPLQQIVNLLNQILQILGG